MYFCRGLNWTDLCNLRHSDLVNGRIIYHRKKTGKKFSIKLNQNHLDILDHYNQPKYIFPILSSFHKSPKQKANRIKKCLKQTNTSLKQIALKLNINPNITSYTARHTYAMNLKRAGINLNIISDAMGHADSKITRVYLSRFEDEMIDETDKYL